MFHNKSVFRLMAIALLAVCAGFTFPESHYSVDKTFVKAPSPQTEISSLLCDDVEDSNDLSTGVQFFQNAVVAEWSISSELLPFTSSTLKEISPFVDAPVYLRHRQLLI
jgi:hypothetical protein